MADPTWVDLTKLRGADFTPVPWEDNLDVLAGFARGHRQRTTVRGVPGLLRELAALGIAKGQPFDPDERMRDIFTRAAEIGPAQLRVQSFADSRPDPVVWPGTHWEWAVLRPENGTFDTPAYHDGYARQKWFYQAQIESPAMFRRTPAPDRCTGSASATSMGTTSTVAAPTPSPCPSRSRLSCSGRSPSTTPRPAARSHRPEQAALRSFRTRRPRHRPAGRPALRAHRPRGWCRQPLDPDHPGTGWFVYFRIYGPDRPAFDASWRLPDFRPT